MGNVDRTTCGKENMFEGEYYTFSSGVLYFSSGVSEKLICLIPCYSLIIVADIPGIIKGAHENIGLGHEFLRHIERCHMLMYVMDCSHPDMMNQFEILKRELDLYKSGLSKISSVFIANKCDLIDDVDTLQNDIQQLVNMPVVPISAKFNQNLEQLKEILLNKWRVKEL